MNENEKVHAIEGEKKYDADDIVKSYESDVSTQREESSSTLRTDQEKTPGGESTDLITDTKIDNESEENIPENSKEELLNETLQLTDKMFFLIKHIKETKKSCEHMEGQNKYLQDYVGSLMTTGDINKS